VSDAAAAGGVRPLRIVVATLLGLTFGVCLIGILLTGPIVIRLNPAIEIDVDVSPARLRANVETLSTDFSPRDSLHPEKLEQAADWIGERFRAAGLEVEDQPYEAPGGTFRNVIARRTGFDDTRGVIIIGAHYDAFGGFPGADDNASGVAALLELADTLPHGATRATHYFVAFGTEEPPYFRTDGMGSYVFAQSLKERDVDVAVMISLDMVGYFSDASDSQGFPFGPLAFLYPDTGNFVAIVGDTRSGRSIERVKRAMASTQAIDVHSFRAPTWVQGIDWSDHLSFRRLGYPAVLVTDTSFMRNPHYHKAGDSPSTLDYQRMSQVVVALHGVLWERRETPDVASP
jgi:hypothetical protein